MPTRIPLPRHEPPSLTDRLNAHSEGFVVIGLFWAYAGALTLLFGPPSVVTHVPALTAWALAVLTLLGGCLVVAAIVWPGADSTAWTLETTGYAFGAGAWLAHTLGERDPFFAGLGAAFVVLGVWRITYRLVQREAYHRGPSRARMRARLRE